MKELPADLVPLRLSTHHIISPDVHAALGRLVLGQAKVLALEHLKGVAAVLGARLHVKVFAGGAWCGGRLRVEKNSKSAALDRHRILPRSRAARMALSHNILAGDHEVCRPAEGNVVVVLAVVCRFTVALVDINAAGGFLQG